MESILQKFDSLEMNVLHRAVQSNEEAVKYLLESGADVTNTINQGQTPLHLAADLGYVHVMAQLLEKKSREEMRSLINRRTLDNGIAALHLAARKNSYVTVRYLLRRGANFEIRDKENRQAKHHTTDKRIIQLIDRIAAVFESIPTRGSKVLLERLKLCESSEPVAYVRNDQGFTSLQLAMEKNHLEAVGTIIDYRIERLEQNPWEAGAELDDLMRHSKAARGNISNLDVLHHEDDYFAVRREVADLMRHAHEFLEVYKKQRDPSFDEQPLLNIVEESLEFFGSWETSKFVGNKRVDSLLRKGPAFAAQMLKLCIVAPIQFFMRLVYTSELLTAAKFNDSSLVEKCLTGHPDMNERDDNDWTALHYALNNRNAKMFELLLTLGADPTSASERNGETLLHFLSRRNYGHGVAKMLFDSVSVEGVNARTISDDRSIALHSAAKEHNYPLVKFLLARGSTYSAKDAHGKMPKDYCRGLGGVIVFDLLNNVDRLFAKARDGKVEDSVTTMRRESGNNRLAFGGARDDEGRTLDEVLELEGHVEAANEIRKLLRDVDWN